MNYQIFRILERPEVNRITESLAGSAFVDGRLTAHGAAREVKRNLQLDRTGPELSDIDQLVISALRRNEDFMSFAIPKRMMYPLFSRYEPGMQYGTHVDGALMGGLPGDTVRSDFAITLFLSSPETYDGGELVVELPVGEQEIKLDAGEAIVYGAGTLHYVSPVTRGVRLAAIVWVQSAVRDEQIRAVLYDLSQAVRHTESLSDPHLSRLLSKSYHNLLRHAAEP
jgi:PKHD-type hydroxylase